MLAYLFWHRPADGGSVDAYEQSLSHFHRSLHARPPEGFRGSRSYRTPELPWLAGGEGYEDWYLIEDYSALGVLGEAAVAAGHRSAHEQAARGMGAGTGGLYRLCEGVAQPQSVRVAVWVTPAKPSPELAVQALLLGDGAGRQAGALWRRELVLGPAPEYCLLGVEAPAGVAPTRLPDGWSATLSAREQIAEDQ